MKHILLLLLFLLSFAILTLWLASYAIPGERTYIATQNTYHLSNRQGILSLSTFSNTPEDDSYKSLSLRYWILCLFTAIPTLLLLLRFQKGRRNPKPGFPV